MASVQGITRKSWGQSHRLLKSNLPVPLEILGSLSHS